jgi:hypothetical protein
MAGRKNTSKTPEIEVPFEPKFPLDLDTIKPKAFENMKESFDAWIIAEPLTEPLTLTTGWHTVTPEEAQQLLRRNRPGANRKVSLATVLYYAHQMAQGEWPKTGQPVIFDENGVLIDGQHRLWGCLYSSTAFTTMVVTDVPAIPNLFAYIDNCRARSPAAALQTAGFNGVSPTIVAIMKIAVEIDAGIYTASTAGSIPRLTPIEYLRLTEKYPNAKSAARLVSSDHVDVIKMTGRKDAVCYMFMAIMDRHGQEEADRFFYDVADLNNDYGADSAIMALRKLIANDQKAPRPMKRHQMVGNMIKAFNHWHADLPVKARWFMGAHEDMPVFTTEIEELQAAE